MPSSHNKRISGLLQSVKEQPLLHFGWGWAAVFAIAFLDVLWASHNWLALPVPWPVFTGFLVLISVKFFYCWLCNLNIPSLRRKMTSFRKSDVGNRAFLGIEFFLLARSASIAVCVLTYLACTLPYPLIDSSLNRIDHALGFDWATWFRWNAHYPGFILLKSIYYSLLFQTVLFVTWFSYLSDKRRLYELFWILLFGVVLTACLSGLLPAVGPVFALPELQDQFAHIQPLGKTIYLDVMAIKSGMRPDFAAHGLTGIITFPSFHTVCAIAYMYGFRRTGFLGYGIFLLNVLVLLSIPSIGNHYLTDLIAGAAIAFVAILTVKFLSKNEVRCR